MMTADQLRKSILQRAIQGKLVPQDPNDEPASVLLEKIRAEKARLVKEKKIKKSKNESIIFKGDDNRYYEKFENGTVKCIEDEVPFEVPESWAWCRLESIGDFKGGKTPPMHNPKLWGGNINWVTSKDMKSRHISNSLLKISEEALSDMELFPVGTILFVARSGILKRTLPVAFLTKESTINQDLKAFLLYCNYISKYIYYVLKGYESFILENYVKSVTTVESLKFEEFKKLLVPLPSLSEQDRIIKSIENVELSIDQYYQFGQTKMQLEREFPELLKKSILQYAIQGKLIPQNPNDEPASVLLEKIRAGKERLIKDKKIKLDKHDSVIFKGDDNKYYEQIGGEAVQIETDYDFPNTWKVVRLAYICRLVDGEKKEGNHVCLDAKYLRGKSFGNIQARGKFVTTGDNIILVDGENSGEVFTVPCDGYVGSTFKQLWVSEIMYLAYVLYYIQLNKDLLRNSKKGAAIPHLNKEIFYSLLIGIPPYQEQERITRYIDTLLDKIKE